MSIPPSVTSPGQGDHGVVTFLPDAMTTMTSRTFNQDTGGAKKAAERGPVYVTDRGRPSHVLLTFDDYQQLAGLQRDIIDLLGQPVGIEDVSLPLAEDYSANSPAKSG